MSKWSFYNSTSSLLQTKSHARYIGSHLP